MKIPCSLRTLVRLLSGVLLVGSMAIQGAQAIEVPVAGYLEAAFSPSGGAEALVIKVIDSARKEIRVMAYSFTNAQITRALLNARSRGVSVVLVVDHEENMNDKKDRYGKAKAALSALATAGCDVRTISKFSISHDKVLIVDGMHLETGSFNYSQAAEKKNSENVLVTWNNPALAQVYLQHFNRNYQLSERFEMRY